jgi:predicted nucleic acid-binding protein
VNALIDTSVWSLALRRKVEDLSAAERLFVEELRELVQEGRCRVIGPVRQELLSGVKSPDQYEKLRLTLRSFRDEPLDTSDFEAAAKASNECRSKGIVVSIVDSLLCAVALSRQWSIFTADPDFKNYAKVLPIELHSHQRSLPS